jgi:predicted dienelactone hydrolase
MYDPFRSGKYQVDTRSIEITDSARGTIFPCDIWSPKEAEAFPLILFSHHSGGNRRCATFLTMHLAAHGYTVAALNHSETVSPVLAPQPDETPEQRRARAEGWIANRVPDLSMLLDYLLVQESKILRDKIGVAGHSLGDWSALVAADADSQIRSVVALAPGGASNPQPGILPLSLKLTRPVPTLLLAAENDVPLPLDGMKEIFSRLLGPKQMLILRRADHLHFLDDVEKHHEAFRAMTLPGDAAWIPKAMLPISELSSGEQAHTFTRGLSTAHFDATLKESGEAKAFLKGDLVAALHARNVDALTYSR